MPKATLFHRQQADRRRQRSLPAVWQPLVLGFGLLTLLTYLAFIPDYYQALVSRCILQDCAPAGPAPPTTEALLRLDGLTVSRYAVLFVFIDSVFTVLFAAASFVIAVKGRREPMALLASVMLVSFGTTFPQLVHTASLGRLFWEGWFGAVGTAGWITFFMFFCLFPDGRFVPRWTAVPTVLFAAFKLAALFRIPHLDHNEWPLPLAFLLFALPVGILIYSQIHRYRKESTPEQRQQTKWILYGLVIGLAGFLTLSLIFDPKLFAAPLSYVYLNGFLHAFLLAIPFTLVLAVLRRRLWEVDPVVNRTLVYASLSASIVALYSFSILFLGKMLHTEDRFLPSLISTVVVALLFAPLKERLQRSVDRMMKGRHDDPYGMLSELRSLLVKPLPPEAMMSTVVRFIRQSLRIPYAAIAIELNGQERLVASDPDGAVPAEKYTIPIIHLGKETGAFIAGTRPGEPFQAGDLRLLDVLLGHAGPIVDNYVMTRGMKLLAEDLQQSREKLVLAREEERRTIRRNLHDGLAPRLAAIGLNAAAAEMNVSRNPEAAVELLAELRQVIRTTVEDIRTLVHSMRPASLDEWGLVGALQQRGRELTRPLQLAEAEGETAKSLTIGFEVPRELPELPAAVEVAAYWIVSEAMTNVVRHAEAGSCLVRLYMASPAQLTVEILDDGVGLDDRWGGREQRGIGLASIRERTAELGGVCSMERLPGGGTKVSASLPVMAE